ncbi:sulfatase-like hydrolase/transferase [Haloferula sp.]|uniref:sulfatase-like hydrolase/transferase n=1 Tax=Haloferula sp. TaxID=2497595 RepID=UPI00329D5AE2
MTRALLTSFALSSALLAEPITTSWFTELSGQYARVYPSTTEETATIPVTSWTHPNGGTGQPAPTYAGVSEVSITATDLYIRTSGLAFHIMGPWYGGGGLFPNYPSNIARTARFPLTPQVSLLPKPLTGLGAIGYFVDGVAMFDSRDAFSYIYDTGDATPQTLPESGDGVWNRDAYVNESDTFDPANAHQAGGTHHYHANPSGLRHVLNDSVSYDIPSNTYTESPSGHHSPILAWTFDGFPLYGPYGFSDPLDPESGVRRMISGYQTRDGSNGSDDLNIIGRSSLPAWITRNEASRSNPLATTQYGPAVNGTYTLGHYLEDYAYKGDLTGHRLYEGVAANGAHNAATDYDLDEYNVRWCVTPEFPAGTWAYFSCIATDGTPVFPYNIGRYYFGNVQGANNANLPASRQIIFEGGPEAELKMAISDIDEASGDVSLTWSSVEGGQYLIESSDLAEPWVPIASPRANGSSTTVTDAGRAATDSSHYYRAEFQYLAPFDDNGFAYDNSIVSEGPQNNVLLLILDDWGIDSSALYNEEPGANLAEMPNLEALANAGLLFTRGYSQPICSPTRATILTGRQTYQHNVGNPGDDATLPSSELTFPEIMATEAPDYGIASFGKWHLGSGSTGPLDTGGWPNFSGTQQGGVGDYANWTRIKIENGVLTDPGTNINTLVANEEYDSPYATSVQVDEAISFITDQGAEPWVVWMGFNAPHDPFHDPDPYVDINYSTTGTTNGDYYIKMLEALDHEIGRLLTSLDLANTNIIVVGDNGTPGQVDQAPAGGIAGAKGSLNEGGIHVPFFAAGPDVTVTGTTDKMVHVVDLFATILELTNVNVPTATQGIDIHSQSIVPIFSGNDMADRCVIAEKFNLNPAQDGRALMMDDWPQYKLISIQDVTDPNDTPVYQMYELGSNGVEANTITTPPNPGDPHEAAYNALVAKDQSLIPTTPAVVGDTLFLQLPEEMGHAGVPGNANVAPDTIIIDGVLATYVGRLDTSDTYDQFWVKCTLPDTESAPYTTAVVAFPDNPNTGATRVFTADNIFVAQQAAN